MHCYPQRHETVLRSNLVALTAATAVTLDEFKMHARIDGDEEDDVLEMYIEAATKEAELYTRRALRESSWQVITDRFHYCLSLDVAPIDASTIVVKYYDAANTEQTLSAAQYTVKNFGPDEYLQIVFDGTSLPVLRDRWDAVKIEFDAGYATIPAKVKVWIMDKAASLYENRQDQVIGAVAHTVYSFAPLMPYRML